MKLLWLLSGAGLSWLNHWSRVWTVARLHPHRLESGVAWIEIGLLLRLVLTAGVLTLAMHDGLLDGLLAFGGLWGMRWWIIHHLSPLYGLEPPGAGRKLHIL